MKNVLRMVGISLKQPAIKLIKVVTFLAIWAGISTGLVALISMIFDSHWLGILFSGGGVLLTMLSGAVTVGLFAYAHKIEEALEYAKWQGVPYEIAWRAVIR